jgi:hypothetical protein
MECRSCDTSIQGRFFTGPFAQLTPEQLSFIEIFIRNEGKLTRMEKALELSYPTIRNRLHEVIRAMGFEPGEEDLIGPSEEMRKQILDDLDSGNIDYEDAVRKLMEREA